MNWREIIGHQEAIAICQTMVSTGKMPHALLFTGPAGIGKSTAAKIMAAGILCSSHADKPCGQCPSCQLYSRNAHPDFSLITPDGTAIKIDQIRALQHFASLTPTVSPGRVCIIEGAEAMTVQAANSLLKLLEEPPAGFVFILTAGTGKPLLPTVVSRCWKIPFQPLPAALLEQALLNKGYATEAAAVAARLSSGRMGKALSLLEPDGLELRNTAAALLARLQAGGMSAVWQETARLETLDSKHVAGVLEFLLYLLRDVMFIASGYSEQLLYNIDLVPELANWTPLWPEARSMAAMAHVKAASRALESNANTRLTLEELFIKIEEWPEKGD